MVVRPDGLRIAIILLTSVQGAAETWVHRWAEYVHRRRLDDSGIVVIFGAAESPATPCLGVPGRLRRTVRGLHRLPQLAGAQLRVGAKRGGAGHATVAWRIE
ncbi:hypothetical protein ACFOYW_14205 [Gryllotalpicola reticulitermitis]|uniref:Uncharacterized protein n=1 Tax=Gryllotalpicola reticulitermitis TaxID=1184153 RepID=A0ABV8Q825_9MICO